jgi:lipoprotein-anchoring transpeptidase ErfK/SrfK
MSQTNFSLAEIVSPKATPLFSSALPVALAVSSTANVDATTTPPVVTYVEVVDSCGPYFDGECVRVRSGPGTAYSVVMRLRKGVVLRVGEVVTEDGVAWYKIYFAHDLLYPERVKGSWYVAASLVVPLSNVSDDTFAKGDSTTTKHILVDRSQEMLYAYDGVELFMQVPISIGMEFTPTPLGTFTVFKMTPSRFMQGPIPGVSSQVYDLPGVPWNLYFTQGGAVIHGAYWHDHFGQPWSHGCVNLWPDDAKKLYAWSVVGMKVVIQE